MTDKVITEEALQALLGSVMGLQAIVSVLAQSATSEQVRQIEAILQRQIDDPANHPAQKARLESFLYLLPDVEDAKRLH